MIVTAGLIRFGPSFENIAWASLFLAPLGCIYYPIDILPDWLQLLANGLPLVHIFEEMRNILINDTFIISSIFTAFIISLIYFVLGVIIFYIAYFGARKGNTNKYGRIMKLIDCFMYFDEDLVLDIRLNTLNDIVDRFVIVEATTDHAGNQKN